LSSDQHNIWKFSKYRNIQPVTGNICDGNIADVSDNVWQTKNVLLYSVWVVSQARRRSEVRSKWSATLKNKDNVSLMQEA
jgi:hypothetical protein